jgi:hypothetical protein
VALVTCGFASPSTEIVLEVLAAVAMGAIAMGEWAGLRGCIMSVGRFSPDTTSLKVASAVTGGLGGRGVGVAFPLACLGREGCPLRRARASCWLSWF